MSLQSLSYVIILLSKLEGAKGGSFFFSTGGVFMADRVVLECTQCKNRNYVTYKNKKKTTERLELKKYCKFCKEHTTHKETK